MDVISSRAWDRFSTVWAVLFSIAGVAAAINLIVNGWRGIFFDGTLGPGGPDLPPAISLIAFIPLAVWSWRVAKWPLDFTPTGIVGLSKKREVPYGEIYRWAALGRTLYLWPAAPTERTVGGPRQVSSSLVGALWLHPSVPRGANWMTVDPAHADAIAGLLTTHVGTAETLPAKTPWWQIGSRNVHLWRAE